MIYPTAYPTLALDFPVSCAFRVTFNRPEAANALNAALGADLAACLNNLPREARVVVLTGAGNRAFCAGADLKERQGMDEAQWEEQHKHLRSARDAVLTCPLPVIAAVNGAALGGGCELALACDFIYAAENAVFALPEARLGIMPGMGGTQLLPRAVGERRAKELMYTGRRFSAQEAQEWGMVNRVCAGERLMDEVLAVAEEMAASAPGSVAALKRVIRDGLEGNLQAGLVLEREAYLKRVASADRVEGIAAFNEKRKPRFDGA